MRHGTSDLLDQPRSSEMELLLAVRVDLIVFTDQSNQTSVHTGTSVRKALRPDTPRRMKKAGPTDRVSCKKRRRPLRLSPCARVNVESERVELDSVPATDHALCSHLSVSRTEHRHEEVEHDDGENEQVCLAEDASNKKRGHGESDGGTNKGRYC